MRNKIVLMTYYKGRIETVKAGGDYQLYENVTQSTISRFERIQGNSIKIHFQFPYKSTTPAISIYFLGAIQ